MMDLQSWKDRGYQFEDGLNLPAGKIKTNNRSLCFYSEKEPTKCQTMARWSMQIFLGRKLEDVEVVRFKTADHTDLRVSNLKLRSKLASAKELYSVNGPPILGYSHCLCGCGEALDVEKQCDQPHAYVIGHSPADKRRSATLEAAVNGEEKKKRKRREKKKPPVEPVPLSFTPTLEIDSEEALKPYRPLFERMICDLEWVKFRRVLQVLLQMERLEVATHRKESLNA